jgi:hypothetical protein
MLKAIQKSTTRKPRQRLLLSCSVCRRDFQASRKTAKYCSDACKIAARPNQVAGRLAKERDGYRCTFTAHGEVCGRTADTMYAPFLYGHMKGFRVLQRRLKKIQSPLAFLMETRVTLCAEHHRIMRQAKSRASSSTGTQLVEWEAVMPGPPEVFRGAVRNGYVHLCLEDYMAGLARQEEQEQSWFDEDLPFGDRLDRYSGTVAI